MAFWDDIQTAYNRMSPTQRKKRFHELTTARGDGWTDIKTAVEWCLLKCKGRIAARDIADGMKGAIRRGEIRSSIEIEGEHHVLPPEVFRKPH